MRNIDCEIIQDLLPLYVDDVCSEKSIDMIEEHLRECEECRNYCEALQEELPVISKDFTSSNLLEGEFIRKVEKTIKHKITFDMVIAGFVVFLVCAMGSVLLDRYPHEPGFALCGLIDQRLETDVVEITNLYQLENGEIYFEIKSEEKVTWPYTNGMEYDEEKDMYYGTAMYTYSWWTDHIEQSGTIKEGAFVYPTNPKDMNGYSHEISEIYFEGKNDDKILVWKKGQQLEPAPAEIEERVKEAHSESGEEDGSYWMFTKNTSVE